MGVGTGRDGTGRESGGFGCSKGFGRWRREVATKVLLSYYLFARASLLYHETKYLLFDPDRTRDVKHELSKRIDHPSIGLPACLPDLTTLSE